MIWSFLGGIGVGVALTLALLYWAECYMRKQIQTSHGFTGQVDGGVGFRGDLSAKVLKKAM